MGIELLFGELKTQYELGEFDTNKKHVVEIARQQPDMDRRKTLVVHRRTGCLIIHASVRVVLSHRMSESVHPEVC
jgi:hypothetical protein